MMRALVMFDAPDEPWLRIDDAAIVARGTQATSVETDEGEARILVPLADAVGLHPLELAGLAPAQAAAAARLALADQCLLPPEAMHLTCNAQGVAATVSYGKMQDWIDRFDPDTIIPSPLILPRPEDGFVKAALGHETVLRSASTGFADDPVLTDLLVGDADVQILERETVEAGLIRAISEPELNLRQGVFARQIKLVFDQRLLRACAIGLAALALLSLALPLIQILRLNNASATLEATVTSTAQSALGEEVAPDAAATTLDARLAELRGGGAGFSATAAAVRAAVEAVGNVELGSLSFEPDGQMRMLARATVPAELDAFVAQLRARGLIVTPGAINPAQGQPSIDIQVRGQ